MDPIAEAQKSRNKNAAFSAAFLVLLIFQVFATPNVKYDDSRAVGHFCVYFFAFGFIFCGCRAAWGQFKVAWLSSQRNGQRARLEGRLAEVERLKNENLITAQEYEAKRQDILKNL